MYVLDCMHFVIMNLCFNMYVKFNFLNVLYFLYYLICNFVFLLCFYIVFKKQKEEIIKKITKFSLPKNTRENHHYILKYPEVRAGI